MVNSSGLKFGSQTLLHPGTSSWRNFILSLIFSLLTCNVYIILQFSSSKILILIRDNFSQYLTLSARLWLFVAWPRRALTCMYSSLGGSEVWEPCLAFFPEALVWSPFCWFSGLSFAPSLCNSRAPSSLSLSASYQKEQINHIREISITKNQTHNKIQLTNHKSYLSISFPFLRI